jgi:hypothetical protein
MSYSDSPYCTGNVYNAADGSGITVTGKSSADRYTGIVTELAECTFYVNGVQKHQVYGSDKPTYSKADTAQNGYKTTQVSGSVSSVSVPSVSDLYDGSSTDDKFVDTRYYILYNGQYYRLGVRVSSDWLSRRDYEFAWYTDNGTYQKIGSVDNTTYPYSRKLDAGTVDWDYKPQGYFTLNTPSTLDTSKQYLVVGPGGAYGSTGNPSDGIVVNPFASTFKQRDSLYNSIWTLGISGSKHTWTTVAHGYVFEEPNPVLTIPGKFTSPVVKYTINQAVCDLYIVEVDPSGAYYKVLFTYQPGGADIREYITAK